MLSITTKLIKDGNSTAVRLPKSLLEMSGLGQTVELEAKKGQIIVRKSKQSRHGWESKIASVVGSKKPLVDKELSDWDNILLDGLDDKKT